ncbi:hypothetical protein [Luteibacter yeojuensis]|uniref:Uncharacterized protein n=1 Tax=Luteibacter yeojuensis TaxID=345309 RepID=A0A7X5QR12_9GAMM|nr:hypothetical protein [Luteibacter yeojuensis]NID13856.1 hypothetical protein [Luteibacter yeojuensis]
MSLVKVACILAAFLLVGWMSYWAGFTKALEIGLYNNQLHDEAQAREYEVLASKLAAGRTEEVRSHLNVVGDILKQQARIAGSEDFSVLDLLVPSSALSLVRDYEARRRHASARGSAPDSSREHH